MPDIPPTRRKRGRPPGSRNKVRQSALPGSRSAVRQRESLNAPLPLPTGIGESYGVNGSDPEDTGTGDSPYAMEWEEDTPPANNLRVYRGKYGALKGNIVTTYGGLSFLFGGPFTKDGRLFADNASPIADAWINWGKESPSNMKMVQLLWGSALITLIMAHTPLVLGVASNHGVKIPFARIFSPVNMERIDAVRHGMTAQHFAETPAQEAGEPESPTPYEPVGAYAPTEDPGPPPPYEEQPMLVIPDEGLPSEIDVMLRQMARENPRLKYEALVEEAKFMIAQRQLLEKHKAVGKKPEGLGHPIYKPE